MIKVFVGPMFSGKSGALINIYNNIWNKENILLFKSKKDTRDKGVIKSRNTKGIKVILINNLSQIDEYVSKKVKTIFIDEAQFLEGDVRILLNFSIVKNIDIYIAGLPMTAEQKPFGLMPELLAIADVVKNFKATCFDCNKEANYTYFKGTKKNDIFIGSDEYLPLCDKCLAKRRNRRKNGKWLLENDVKIASKQ